MSPAGQAELSIEAPHQPAQIVKLTQDRYDLGRGSTNLLYFPDVQGLSRKHLAFARDGSKWVIQDLGSTNGTFVNGTQITQPQVLRPNDRVTAGELRILFSDPTQTVVFSDNPASQSSSSMEVTLAGVLRGDGELQRSVHMKALIDAGRELCARSSLAELFEVIMNLSVEAVRAARGVLITRDNEEFRVRASRGAGFSISSHVRDSVFRERRSLLVRDALTDEVLAARMSIMQDQVRGILAVPLQTEEKVIGLIYLDSPVHLHEFTRDDLNVLTVLANIAAIRVEQARLAEIEQAEKLRARELEHAALIQRSMLPWEFPPFPSRRDFDLHAAMVPAKEVGGDLFDFFLLDDDHLGFVIGDVSGKGVPAALFMAVARTLLRATAQNQKGPDECFTYMNNALAEGNVAGMFVTVFYGVLDTRSGDLTFANAGHNPPLIFSSDGRLRKLSQRCGPMLGVFEGHKYQVQSTRIEPGEGILLFTDGITEAANKSDEFFGDERLEGYLAAHAAEAAQPIVTGLQAAVQEFATGIPQRDDITVLALRFLGETQEQPTQFSGIR